MTCYQKDESAWKNEETDSDDNITGGTTKVDWSERLGLQNCFRFLQFRSCCPSGPYQACWGTKCFGFVSKLPWIQSERNSETETVCSFSLPHYIFLLVPLWLWNSVAPILLCWRWDCTGFPVYAVIAVSIFPCAHKSYQTSADFLILTSGDSGNDVLIVVSMEIRVRIPGMSPSEFLISQCHWA